jgi:hypothetical protein
VIPCGGGGCAEQKTTTTTAWLLLLLFVVWVYAILKQQTCFKQNTTIHQLATKLNFEKQYSRNRFHLTMYLCWCNIGIHRLDKQLKNNYPITRHHQKILRE